MAYIPTPEEAAAIEARWVELWVEGKAPTKAEMPVSMRASTPARKAAKEKQQIGPVHNPERGAPVDPSVWTENIRSAEARDAAKRAREDERTAQQAHVRARRMEGITNRSRSKSIWLGKI